MTGGIIVVVGNPKPGSRTLNAAERLAGALGSAIGLSAEAAPVDLATLADGLLAPVAAIPRGRRGG